MSVVSKPVAGQWYEFDGERIWFVGYGQDGVACFQRENCDPSWVINSHTSRFKHLPDCTGWDWTPQPPAESPDDWVTLPMDHKIRAEVDWYDYGGFFDYVCKGSALIGVTVGATTSKKVRCRRRDLPAKAPAKRRVSVPMWLVTNKENEDGRE